MLTEEYRPTSREELVGNSDAIQKVDKWLKNWDSSFEPLLLYGRAGVGKTTAAHVLGRENELDVTELNASQKRNYDELKDSLVEMAQGRTVNYEPRLIIVDEVDSLGRNGPKAVREAFDKMESRVILICNDLYDGVNRSLRRRCETVEFSLIKNKYVEQRLEQIVEQEPFVELTNRAMMRIVDIADGDMRAAVNTLQATIRGVRADVPAEEPNPLFSLYDRQGDEYCSFDDVEKLTDERIDWAQEQIDYIPELDRVLILGPEHLDDAEVIETVSSQWIDEDHDEWFIPAFRGFCIEVAEYAIENDIPFHLILPERFEEHTDSWDDADVNDLLRLYRESEGVGVIFDTTEYNESQLYEKLCHGVSSVKLWDTPDEEFSVGISPEIDSIDLEQRYNEFAT